MAFLINLPSKCYKFIIHCTCVYLNVMSHMQNIYSFKSDLLLLMLNDNYFYACTECILYRVRSEDSSHTSATSFHDFRHSV